MITSMLKMTTTTAPVVKAKVEERVVKEAKEVKAKAVARAVKEAKEERAKVVVKVVRAEKVRKEPKEAVLQMITTLQVGMIITTLVTMVSCKILLSSNH
jgi:hypothetical protein